MDLTQKLLVLVLILSVCSLWTSGLSEAADVDQVSVLWVTQSDPARLDCSHTKGATYYQMYWYQQLPGRHLKQVMLSVSGSPPTMEAGFSSDKFSSVRPDATKGTLEVKDTTPGDGGWYFCAVSDGYNQLYFGSGTKLTVLDPDIEVTAPTVRVLRPSSNQTGDDRTLVCVASGFYPDHVSVSWKVDDITRLDGVATDDEATRQKNKFYRITSRLTVPVRVWQNRGRTFSCEVNFFNGTDYLLFSESIRGVKVDSKARAKYLKITQSAKLAYCAFIVKSCVYGAFLVFLLWKLQKSRGKK